MPPLKRLKNIAMVFEKLYRNTLKAQDALSPLLGSKIQANIFVLNLRLFDYSQLLISLQAIRKFLRERPKCPSSGERQEAALRRKL